MNYYCKRIADVSIFRACSKGRRFSTKSGAISVIIMTPTVTPVRERNLGASRTVSRETQSMPSNKVMSFRVSSRLIVIVFNVEDRTVDSVCDRNAMFDDGICAYLIRRWRK